MILFASKTRHSQRKERKVIRYENRQYWREMKDGGLLDFASTGPQQAVTEVLCTGTVVIRATTIDDDGEVVGEPFLVGVAQAGSTPVRIRHGAGMVLSFHFAKGTECWLYDDREGHQAVAPVGVSFTVFEMPGHLMNDPVQILVHRENVRQALQRQLDRVNPQPDRIGEMEALVARLTERLEKAEKASAPKPDDNAGAEHSAEG